jgi:hypothetical protein
MISAQLSSKAAIEEFLLTQELRIHFSSGKDAA